MYGIIRLTIGARNTRPEEVFVESLVNKDAILGILFRTAYNCSLVFTRPVLLVDSRELTCTDRYRKLPISNMQVTCGVVIPLLTETVLLCRFTARNFHPLRSVKCYPEKLPVATTLNRPQNSFCVVARCINLTVQPCLKSVPSFLSTKDRCKRCTLDCTYVLYFVLSIILI